MPTASTIWCSNTDNIIREHQGLTSTVLRSVDVTSIADTDLVSVTTDGTVTGSEANPIFAYAGGGVQHVVKLQGFTTTPISITDHAVDWDMTGVTWDGVHLLTSANGDVDSGDLLQKWDGLTTTLKESITIGDVNPVGITWDGEDCIFTARWRFSAKGVIRRLWGFSGTTRTAISTDTTVGIGNADPSDVSFDGTDVLFSGDSPQRIYRLTGYTATVAAFLDVTVNPDGLEHGVYSERQPQTDLQGPYVSGSQSDRVAQMLGWSSSIRAVADLAGIQLDVRDVCIDADDDVMILGRNPRGAHKLDGLSSTIASSFLLDSTNGPEACTWDGDRFLVGDQSYDTAFRFADFTSTLESSLTIPSIERSVRGIAWSASDLFMTGRDGRLLHLAGFTTTIRAEAAIFGEGLSRSLTQPWLVIWGFLDGRSHIVETDGVTTTVVRSFDVDAFDTASTGIEAGRLSDRLMGTPPLSGAALRTHGRRRRPEVRQHRPHRMGFVHTGEDAVMGGWPLRLRNAQRARSLLRAEAKSSRKTWEAHLPPAGIGHHYFMGRGKHRIWNAPVYRIYRRLGEPPRESDTPFATSTSLPHTPAATFSDGTWYVAVSYFNGVLDSGFLPVGPKGEPHLRFDVNGGTSTGQPPIGPMDVQLLVAAGGVVRVVGLYLQTDSGRADEWALSYTVDGTEPTGAPTVTASIQPEGVAVFDYALPAQPNGTVVKARLRTRRDDAGTWVYSSGFTRTAVADVNGSASPYPGVTWPGLIHGTL